MKVTYLCPHCRGAINAGNNIILSAKTSTNKVGLILLHEEIGNYTSDLSASLTVEIGEVVDLFCPVCHESLNTPKKDALAKYIRIDNGIKESYIIISRKYGEKITFKVDENKQIESYGEKLSRFIDPEWFL
ncbi:MAG: hypothetical protein H8D45_11570 [Bacteroidetes bacterium]|nr:hypothetical protein [Bacteroidota bacterium]MBL7103520.1 hypothetical protein [Bacteroidales bacterium]